MSRIFIFIKVSRNGIRSSISWYWPVICDFVLVQKVHAITLSANRSITTKHNLINDSLLWFIFLIYQRFFESIAQCILDPVWCNSSLVSVVIIPPTPDQLIILNHRLKAAPIPPSVGPQKYLWVIQTSRWNPRSIHCL